MKRQDTSYLCNKCGNLHYLDVSVEKGKSIKGEVKCGREIETKRVDIITMKVTVHGKGNEDTETTTTLV